MRVSIIIVNFNTTEHLIKCLKSIIEFTKDIEFEIIVVDNNSTERDIEKLPALFPKVKFYFRDVNDGFGAGCNFGAKYSKGKYLFFVNPDIIFKDNDMLSFFEFMEKRDDVILCSGLHQDVAANLIYSYNYFPDIKADFRETFYIGHFRHLKSLLNRKEIAENKPFEVDYSLGALLFLRKSSFDLVEGFDDRFFLYCEDVDIEFRLKQLGGKIMCLPNVKVFHYYNSTTNDIESKFLQTNNMHRSKLIYMYKHYSFFERNLTRIMMLIGIWLRLIYLPFNKVHSGNKMKGFSRILKGSVVLFKKLNIKNYAKPIVNL